LNIHIAFEWSKLQNADPVDRNGPADNDEPDRDAATDGAEKNYGVLRK